MVQRINSFIYVCVNERETLFQRNHSPPSLFGFDDNEVWCIFIAEIVGFFFSNNNLRCKGFFFFRKCDVTNLLNGREF